jgi:hypothetical protein
MKRNFVDIDSDRCRLDLRAVTSLLMFGIALDSAASTSRDWEITWSCRTILAQSMGPVSPGNCPANCPAKPQSWSSYRALMRP